MIIYQVLYVKRESYLCSGLVLLLFQLRINLVEELNSLFQLVRLSEVGSKVKLSLSDVIVPFKQVSVPKLTIKIVQQKGRLVSFQRRNGGHRRPRHKART